MTVYIIDLIHPVSLKQLPTTANITTLCLHICTSILESLSQKLRIKDPEIEQILFHYYTILSKYLDTLGKTSTVRADVLNPIVVSHVRVITQQTEVLKVVDINCRSSDIYNILLIKFMDQVLKSTMTCIKSVIPSLSEKLFNECKTVFDTIISDLCRFFDITVLPDSTGFSKALVKVRIENQK
jgi:hypothetical protein